MYGNNVFFIFSGWTSSIEFIKPWCSNYPHTVGSGSLTSQDTIGLFTLSWHPSFLIKMIHWTRFIFVIPMYILYHSWAFCGRDQASSLSLYPTISFSHFQVRGNLALKLLLPISHYMLISSILCFLQIYLLMSGIQKDWPNRQTSLMESPYCKNQILYYSIEYCNSNLCNFYIFLPVVYFVLTADLLWISH